jgi:hypothetical protein
MNYSNATDFLGRVRLNEFSKSLMHDRMTSLSDTLTVGLVLVLLFGAVALYLYTRIQQAEQKITLLESILLDLKMSSEIHSYSELPAAMDSAGVDTKGGASTESTPEPYVPFEDEHEHETSSNTTPSEPSHQEGLASSPLTEVSEHDVEEYKSAVADAVKEDGTEFHDAKPSTSSVSYDTMTLKELQTLAKTRGIVGANTMKKAPIIEALKTSDRVQASSPLDSGFTGSASGTFLETSAAFPASESK